MSIMPTNGSIVSRRRLVCAGLAGTIGMIASSGVRALPNEAVSVIDAAGRIVSLNRIANRLVFMASAHLLALSLLHPDPVTLLAGIPATGPGNDESVKSIFRKRFPSIDGVPTIGLDGQGGVSIERLIALKPDVVVFPLLLQPSNAVIRVLAAAGIGVLILDFSTGVSASTAGSLRILGQIIGKTERAEAYIQFHEERLEILSSLLNLQEIARPRVLVDVHSGTAACCFSQAKGIIADFLAISRAENIVEGVLTGATGQLSPEYVIHRDPEVIIATGGAYSVGKGLSIGEGFNRDTALDSLERLARTPLIQSTTAGRKGRIFGLWHALPGMPINIIVAEVFAKWLWPDRLRDVDPHATLALINQKFLATPMTDTYWIGPVRANAGLGRDRSSETK